MGQIPNGLVAADGNDNVRDTARSRLLAVPEKPDDERDHTDAPEREDEPDRFHGRWSYDASAGLRGVFAASAGEYWGSCCSKRSFGVLEVRLWRSMTSQLACNRGCGVV